MMVPVRSLAEVQALDAGKLNTAARNRVCRKLGTECVMVFTFETERPESTVHVRLFAPLLGVPEIQPPAAPTVRWGPTWSTIARWR